MIQEVVAKAVVGLVPQWIEVGPEAANEALTVGGVDCSFLTLRPLSPDLQRFKEAAQVEGSRWVPWLTENHLLPSSPMVLQEALAIKWLEVLAPEVNWPKVLAYTTSLSSRTFENAAITANLVLSLGQGTVDIADPSLSKLIATLGSSMHSFLRVDGDLRLIDFGSIPWSELGDASDYKLYPEFLHPFNSILEPSDLSVHHTGRGDLLVLKRGGLRAARRKGQWRIYEPAILKDVIGDILKNYQVGANTFEFLLDLSFKRHGALLVYDPERLTLAHVVNRKSIVSAEGGPTDSLREAFGRAVRDVGMGRVNGLAGKKRIMIELASIDGAVVFDDHEVLAIGAMIGTHPQVGSHAGARTTAALSALQYGAQPIKVSSDGDIEVYFGQPNRWQMPAQRCLAFL